ncbi:MAG TPA: DUF1015 domain-containing protein [Bryobacteraceae bacterium]|jgi:uncharacterized protein (DUF1015 family)|nr:DUF1015 domain-containing protein [Bryobacteraceae bacterium]
MARVYPFEPYRYAHSAGPLSKLVTQPYDKISPAMRAHYLAASPYNLVRVLLGERFPADDDSNNVYTRASGLLQEWILSGVLAREDSPSLYAYFQEFTVPDSGERRVRKGFIGLGALEEYSAGVVHRHEQTLSGPKKDRMELLRHTHAHFGQIFMLYDDAGLAVDALLDEAAACPADAVVEDEYKVVHRLWRISTPARIHSIVSAMADRKLLIADGHHRYETALAFGKDNPTLTGADRVMMTFVNMNSPGLTILATHRLVHGLAAFDAARFIASVGARRLRSLSELRDIFGHAAPDRVRIGIALPGSGGIHLFEKPREAGELDVQVLHTRLLGETLGISEADVREEKNVHYVRGLDSAFEAVEAGGAQAAFLLEPVGIQQVAEIAFSGGVMPQKSTDFYPKLLSGLTIYKL